MATSNKLVIAYEDVTLDANTTITGTGWDTNTFSNISSVEFSKKATTTADTTTITIDLERQRVIGIITIPRHTLRKGSTWQIQSYDKNDVLIQDSGIVETWSISEQDYTNIPFADYQDWAANLENLFNPPAIYFLPTGTFAKKFVITFRDLNPTSDPTYSCSVSKVLVAPTWIPVYGVSPNWGVSFATISKSSRTAGGAYLVEDIPRYRKMTFSCKYLKESEAISHIPVLDRDLALSFPYLIIIDPSDSENLHRVYLYGVNNKITPMQHLEHGYFSKTFSLDEWL